MAEVGVCGRRAGGYQGRQQQVQRPGGGDESVESEKLGTLSAHGTEPVLLLCVPGLAAGLRRGGFIIWRAGL